MPGLAFGLKAPKIGNSLSKPAAKRKAAFDDDQTSDDELSSFPTQNDLKKPPRSLKPLNPLSANDSDSDAPRPPKSPKTSYNASATGAYQTTNLAALRNAKLQDQKVAEVDASVYDYDGAYDTFSTPKERSKPANGEPAGPKYMGHLLASSEQRKRDQLRAKEKALQREREQEGDEFADKEKFVTGAYKKQQEEMRVQEEEEKVRVAEEEERRRKGLGMTDFNKTLLRRDEERQRAIEEASRRKTEGEGIVVVEDGTREDMDEAKMAKDLNEKGSHIITNDEGEVVDKRQLLSAGLNTAPKRPGQTTAQTEVKSDQRKQEYSRSTQAHDARLSQRERQTRMMERQLEEMAEKARQAEEAEEKAMLAKNQSRITESEKMSAKERYLARKRERAEAEAKKVKG